MRCDALARKRGTALSRGGGVLRHQVLDRILAETSTAGIGKDRLVGGRGTLLQPSLENLGDIWAQGCAAELAPLALAANVGTGAKRHVLSTESGQLGNPQARLDGDEEQRAVAPSDPGGGAGAVEEGLDLLVDEDSTIPRSKRLLGIASTR